MKDVRPIVHLETKGDILFQRKIERNSKNKNIRDLNEGIKELEFKKKNYCILDRDLNPGL